MKALVLTALMVLSAQAFAATANPIVGNSPVQVASDSTNFNIVSMRVADVASAVKYVDECPTASSPDSETSGCYVTTATVKVVQFSVIYDTTQIAVDDSSTGSLEVNLPVALFSATELQAISVSEVHGLDILGKKTKRNQALANTLVKLTPRLSQVEMPIKECVKESILSTDDGPVSCDQYEIAGSQLADTLWLCATRR